METHIDWKKHVSSTHGLSPTDAQNGILILEEANMVLRIPNPPRLDTLVTMIKGSTNRNLGMLHINHYSCICCKSHACRDLKFCSTTGCFAQDGIREPLGPPRKESNFAAKPTELAVNLRSDQEKIREESKASGAMQDATRDGLPLLKQERPDTAS